MKLQLRTAHKSCDFCHIQSYQSVTKNTWLSTSWWWRIRTQILS